MKTSDLSPDRQMLLVPLKEYLGASALVPPLAPRTLGLKEVFGDVVKSHEAPGAVQAATARLPNPNLATRTLDRREAARLRRGLRGWVISRPVGKLRIR